MIVASPFVGSFLGVAITRIPAGQQILWGRSHCDGCGRSLGAIDLVPVLSWIALRGRCRHCGATLPLFYPLIELASVAVAVVSAFLVRELWVVPATIMGWLMLAIAGIVWRRSRQ